MRHDKTTPGLAVNGSYRLTHWSYILTNKYWNGEIIKCNAFPGYMMTIRDPFRGSVCQHGLKYLRK